MTGHDDLLEAVTRLADAHGVTHHELAVATAELVPDKDALIEELIGDDDRPEVFRDADGQYRWRLVNRGNHATIGTVGEGYGDKAYTMLMARRVTKRRPVDLTDVTE